MNRVISKLKSGFTLIELMVVISIIAILIAVGSISYTKTMKLSRDSRRKSDLEQIRQALETYRGERGEYPATSTWKNDLQNGGFIETVPEDPKYPTYSYSYTRNSQTEYTLQATMEIDGSTYTKHQP